MSDKQKPAHKVDEYWPITGSIWANVNRKNEPYFTFTVQRSYRNERGDYQSATSFSADHSKALQVTIDACWHWIMTTGRQQIREDKQAHDAQASTVTVSPATE